MKNTKEKLIILADKWEDLGIKVDKEICKKFVDLLISRNLSITSIDELKSKIPNFYRKIKRHLNKKFFTYHSIYSNEVINDYFIVVGRRYLNLDYYFLFRIDEKNNKFIIKYISFNKNLNYIQNLQKKLIYKV